MLQKLIEHGTEAQQDCLFAMLGGKVLELTLHMYGCRVIQKALECGSPVRRLPNRHLML